MTRVRKLGATGRKTSRKTKYPQRPQTLAVTFVPDPRDDKSLPRTEEIVKVGSLCPKCRPIREWLTHNNFGDKISGIGKVFNHHSNGLELEKWSLKGCHLCTLVFHGLIERLAWGSKRNCIQSLEPRLNQLRKARQLEIRIKSNESWKSGCYLTATTLIQQRYLQSDRLQIHCSPRLDEIGKSLERTEPASQNSLRVIAGTELAVSTSAAGVLELASLWIQECVAKHKSCNAQMPSSKLPSRLLEITIDHCSMRVRVVGTDQLPKGTKYAALSYCWGSTLGYKLESSTSKVLAEGVTIGLLPKTLQDAVDIAYKLGLKWLWVDSLCILQDSEDDWEKESSQMLDTYSNCYVCIAATGAAQSEEGVYSRRDPLRFQPCPMSKARRDYSCYVLPWDHYRHPVLCFEDSALQRRGWGVQERLLSPRTLNYGPILMWECRETSRAEMGVVSNDYSLRWKKDFWSLVLSQQPQLQSTSAETQEEIFRFWGNIHLTYAEAALTFPSDRLRAIKGIIDAFKTRTGWRNYAGLWEPFMLRELLWKSRVELPIPQALKWPTWSWVAANGSPYAAGLNSVEVAAVVQLYEIPIEGAREGALTAVDISCVKIEVGTGQVLGAPLTRGDWPHGLLPRFQPDMTPWRTPRYFVPLISSNAKISGIGIIPSETISGAFERVSYGEILDLNFGVASSSLFSEEKEYETITLI